MLDISNILNTASAVAKAREDRQEHRDSLGINMSELGTECERSPWYSLRWISQPEHIDGQKARRFETGNIEEKRVLDDLAAAPGVEVARVDPSTNQQWRCYLVGGHVRGKMDGQAIGLPEDPGKIFLIEVKSHNDASFKQLKNQGLLKSKPAHWYQCQMYMYAYDLKVCIYYAINKNTDEEHSEVVEYDDAACKAMLARLGRIIESPRAPIRISETQKHKDCFFCHHKAVCSQEQFGRRHCRSCIHSTAVIEDGRSEGKWICERHNKTLTIEEQKEGCRDHLFHPDVVPGKQVHKGDDFIIYDMKKDGERWTNKVEPPTTRYWFHVEEDRVFTTDGGNPGPSIFELSAEDYAAALAYYAAQKAAP